PVADVVLAHHGAAELLERAGERVADHGGAQVADVHLLGHVRRGVVQHHRLGPLGGGHAQGGRRRRELRHLRGDPVGAQADVQAAGAGALGRLGDVREVPGPDDLRGAVPGLASQPLGQTHRGVALEVRELRGADDRVRVGVLGPEGGGEGGLEALGQRDLGSRHAPRVIGHRATGDSPLPVAPPGAYAGSMRSVLSLILNIIWLLTAGWALFLSYLLAGVIACLLVVTIPFGIASFRIAGFVIWPFGREVVDTGRGGAGSALGTLIWFGVDGWWLRLGHVATARAQAITIIGIPLAWANLKLIPVTCFPFGKQVMDSDSARARMLPTVR